MLMFACMQRFQYVAPAQDTHRFEFTIDDGNAGNSLLEEQLDGVGDLSLWMQCERVSAHNLMNTFIESGYVSRGFRGAADIGA